MKRIIAHVKKQHRKLQELDHKILELIHSAELSFVLILSIVGLAFGFVIHVNNIGDDRTNAEIQTLMATQEGEWLQQFTQTENGRKLLLKLIETQEGRDYLSKVIDNFDKQHAVA
ncbi:MAG: hypothetical protein GXP45_07370 [bacterium]|nr:hypothetical protein [bacterium]